MSCIYILENKINGKCYVGQTIQKLKNRLNCHKSRIRNNYKEPIYEAIRYYGWDNFNIYKIPCDDYSLDYFEIGFIKQMNSLVPNGYNLLTGGHKNRKHSEESKKKMSKARKGIYFGKKHPNIKKIICLDNGEMFFSITEAANKYNLSTTLISKCCRGKLNKTGGYHFKYYDEYISSGKSIEELLSEKCYINKNKWKKRSKEARKKMSIAFKKRLKNNHPRAKKIICLNSGEIFKQIKYAAKKYNISSAQMSRLLNGTIKNKDGLEFKYYKE